MPRPFQSNVTYIALWCGIIILCLSFSGSHAQTACELKNCPNTTFCVEQVSGQADCLVCHESCTGCDGSTDTDCKKCEIGFIKDEGDFEPCESCPDGRYGRDCVGVCHCLNPDKCDKTNGQCTDFVCERGYRNTPYCNESCAEATFGLGCDEECHCPDGDTCNPVNGDCSSGRCHKDWTGPACSERLPKLTVTPQVRAISCDQIQIAWDTFNQEVDIGEGPISKYNIYMQQNGSDTWTLIGMESHPVNQSKMSYLVTTSLINDEVYYFRIDVVALKDDKDSTYVSPGTPSDAVLNLCTIITTPETTTQVVFSRDLFRTVNTEVNTVNITLSWTLHPDYAAYDYRYSIEIQSLGFGNCEETLSKTFKYGPYDGSPIAFTSLQPWRRYRLGVLAEGVNYDLKDSENVTTITDPTVPTGTLTNFTFPKLTDTEVEIRWDPLPCEQQGGTFKFYQVFLLNLNVSGAAELQYALQERELTRARLMPFNTYSVKGQFINTVGQGPMSETIYFQTEEEAPGPVTILGLSATHSTITITFQPISMTTAILETYTIRFSLTATFVNFESKTVSSADNVNTITISRLDPLTKYFLRMYASTRTKIGALGDVQETTTLEAPPPAGEILLRLVSRTTICLTLQWVPPQENEAQITNYRLEIQEATADTSVNTVKVVFTSSERQYQQCSLKPSQLYIVSIFALISTAQISSATENFSTAHGRPATPMEPTFIRSTYTSIIIAIDPVTLSDVEVTAYQIIVQPRGLNNSVIQESYIAAELLPKDVAIRTEFVVGDGLTYGGNENIELERDHYYNISYKALSTLNNLTTESVAYMTAAIQAVPFDPSVAPELKLSLAERTENCLSFTWEIPAEQAPAVTGITVSVKKTADDTSPEPIVSSVNASTRMYEQCDLAPYSLYTVSVTVRTIDSILSVSEDMFITQQATPSSPVPPVFVNSSFTTITVAIEPVVQLDGPLSFYQLQVEKVTPSVNGRRRKRVAGVPGYVTAQLSSSDVPQRIEFVIGNGLNYSGFPNKPLEKESTYVIHYIVAGIQNNITKYNYSSIDPPVKTIPYVPPTPKPPAASDSDDNGALIGIIVALIIILIIIIILLLVWWWWRRRNRFNPYEIQDDDKSQIPLPAFVDNYDPQKYWSEMYNLKDSRHITAGREFVYNEGQRAEMNGDAGGGSSLESPSIKFHQEFTSLPHKSRRATDNAARQNSHLNRFPHLLPYDHSLVKLKPDSNSRNTYINASFIPGYKKTPAYVAAQSPYDEETVLDFWRLIYQKSIKTVVMITNGVEDDIVKCTQYWPEHTKASYGNFLLQLIETTRYADYVIRIISVKLSGEESSRKVRLFQFTSWPDHGVPDDPIPFLELRYKVRSYNDNEKTPILVHCGTGMGRTGVFIAIDALIDQYATESRVMVFDYVRSIRKDRPYMVRTQKQYVFIYEAIFEEFHAGDTLVDLDLKGRYHNWTQKNPRTGHTYLRDQFSLLQMFSRGPTQEECKAALLEINNKKNRYLDVIPSEKHRPLLMSMGGPNQSDYINAFFVDGYLMKNQFILTQTPLHTTIIDFWKLVYDCDVRTIVMIDNFKNEDGTCAEYWPSGNLKQFEPFFIETTASFQQDNITIRNFKILSMKNPKDPARFVRQFQFNAWAEPNSTPQSKTMLLDLIHLAFEWQEESCQNERPVLVHCKDGSSHSGLFASVAVCCEKMEEDGQVDVYQTVKHIKRRRVQCVQDYDQLRFCYKALWDFMNLRMTGGAFTDTLGQNRTEKSYGVASLSLKSYFDTLKMDTSEL